MKKLTKLINYKTQKTKNAKTYNPFDTGDNNGNDYPYDGNDEMSHATKLNKKSKFQMKMKNNKTQFEPIVHNYSKTTTLNATKTKAGGNKLVMPTTEKSNQKQQQQQQQAELKSSASNCANTKATSATSSTARIAFSGSIGVGGGNYNNYASLDRMRNSTSVSKQSIKVKRKWPHLWWKSYGRHRTPSKSWRLKSKLSCWRQLRKKLLCCKRSSSYQYNSDEDDDIDAKFNAYIDELKLRDAREAKEEEEKSKKTAAMNTECNANTIKAEGEKCNRRQLPTISMTSDVHIENNNATNVTLSPPTVCRTPQSPTPTQEITFETSNSQTNSRTITPNNLNCNNRVSFAGLPPRRTKSNANDAKLQRRYSQHLTTSDSLYKSRRVWTWDDSLRSNSDRFLETLEEDVDINGFVMIANESAVINTASTSVNSSRCSVAHSRPSLLQMLTNQNEVRTECDDITDDDIVQDFVVLRGEEAKAAAEELSRSPVMGQRNTNDPTSSPIQSRGSGSSDNWPTQSDEDIDRWVAMHQNRGSFSSLGPRSDSMASVYSGAGEGRYGTVVVKGQVEFGMQYNYKLGALEIHVVRCKDLAAVDAKRNRSDPYVKVYLLPDKSKAGKRKTKVKKHTLNPIFDEVLRFHMPISNLETRTLWLTVWHSDMFGRNDFLGEVNVNLQGRVFDNPQSQWYLLQERSEPFDEVATYRGDIVVGLKYVTPEGSKSKFMRAASLATGGGLRKFGSIKSVASSKTERSAKGGQLHVLVKEAKHLTPIKPNGSCDAFCKSYLLPDRTRSSKQKTPIVKRSTNPNWSYTFIYEDVSLEDLSERALELTVWDHDRLASNEFLGGVRFSLGTCKSYGRQVDWMDASGKELSLWQNMLDRPNFWVEGSVVLRSTLDGIKVIP